MLDNIAQLFFAEDVDFLLTRGVDVLERAEVHYALVDRHRSRSTVLINLSEYRCAACLLAMGEISRGLFFV